MTFLHEGPCLKHEPRRSSYDNNNNISYNNFIRPKYNVYLIFTEAVTTDVDNIKDGIEDANHNGRIDGDNGDGIFCESETWEETSTTAWDSDQDSIRDNKEKEFGYNPVSKDTDNDGLNETQEDLDGDGLLESGETDPTLFDTDGDTLSDKRERDGWSVVIIYEATMERKEEKMVYSDPLKPDADNDSITDFDEFLNLTDPNNNDSDGDGISDWEELNNDYNSSATGIDGEPPEIYYFDVWYDGSDYVGLGPYKIPTKLTLKVRITARDIFGVEYVKVKISGLEERTIQTNLVDNATTNFEWGISGLDKIKRAVWDGFKINITAKDRNGNMGFKEDEQPGIAKMVISILVGPLIKIANAALAFISLVVSIYKTIIETIYNSIIDPIIDGIWNYIKNICTYLDAIVWSMFLFLLVDEESQSYYLNYVFGNIDKLIETIFGPFYPIIQFFIEGIKPILKIVTKIKEFFEAINNYVQDLIKNSILNIFGFSEDSDEGKYLGYIMNMDLWGLVSNEILPSLFQMIFGGEGSKNYPRPDDPEGYPTGRKDGPPPLNEGEVDGKPVSSLTDPEFIVKFGGLIVNLLGGLWFFLNNFVHSSPGYNPATEGSIAAAKKEGTYYTKDLVGKIKKPDTTGFNKIFNKVIELLAKPGAGIIIDIISFAFIGIQAMFPWSIPLKILLYVGSFLFGGLGTAVSMLFDGNPFTGPIGVLLGFVDLAVTLCDFLIYLDSILF